MQKLFILLSLLLAASCGDDGRAPRIAAALGDAELDGVEYAPLHGSLRPGGYMQAVPVEAGYDIPDDGVNVVRLLFTSAEGYTEEWSLLLFPGERLRIGGLLHDDEGNAELEIRGSELYEAMERENTPFGPQIRRLTTLNRIVEAGGQLDEQQQLELDSLTAWNHAYRIVRRLFNLVPPEAAYPDPGGLYPNLMDAHPPFQIDGNFGYTAGVVEMLLQCHDGFLHLLPALPDAWAKGGSVEGLRTRGGFVADFSWKDGRVDKLRLSAPRGGTCRVRVNGEMHDVSLRPGTSWSYPQ